MVEFGQPPLELLQLVDSQVLHVLVRDLLAGDRTRAARQRFLLKVGTQTAPRSNRLRSYRSEDLPRPPNSGRMQGT